MNSPVLSRLLFAALLLCTGLCPVLQASDLSITSTTVVPGANAILRKAKAGALITAGKVVYKSATDGKIYLSKSNDASAAVRQVIGIAISTAATGSIVEYVIEDDNLTIGATVSNGTVYVLSGANAGGIAPLADQTTGWYPTILAVGTSSTTIAFRAGPLRSGTAL
jgi:hypothetical protein